MTISGEILTRFTTVESEVLRTRNMINLNSTNINFNRLNINNIKNNDLLIADLSNVVSSEQNLLLDLSGVVYSEQTLLLDLSGVVADLSKNVHFFYVDTSNETLSWIYGSASGLGSTAWGEGKASGTLSTAWGGGTASGVLSTAWAIGTADGSYATAWGDGKASGTGSTAWADGKASGEASTAWADGKASGKASTAWGKHTIADASYMTAFGINNDISNALVVIGCGDSSANRKDALIIDFSGNTTLNNLICSDLSVNGTLTITSGNIHGPATITIDPAAIGDATGIVHIKGDLYVDGSKIIINSQTLELSDNIIVLNGVKNAVSAGIEVKRHDSSDTSSVFFIWNETLDSWDTCGQKFKAGGFTQLTDVSCSNLDVTGTVSGIDSSMVGLGNVDNTSDVLKPVSTAGQLALDLKANIASPTFTGSSVLKDVSCTNLDVSGVAKFGNLYLTTTSTNISNCVFLNNKLDNSGVDNIAIGHEAFIANTTGHGSVAIGTESLILNTSGIRNTAIGGNSLNKNTVGKNNCALGFGSLKNISDGINNIGIGNSTELHSSSGTNQIVIGHGTIGHEDNVAVIGNILCTAWHPGQTDKVDLGSSLYKFLDIYSAGTIYANDVSCTNLDVSGTLTGNLLGNATTVTNGIYTTSSVTSLNDVSGAGSGEIITTVERTKLDSIEPLADVTDATNVATAGAVMNTGNETIGGTKTFSNTIVGDITSSGSSLLTHVSCTNLDVSDNLNVRGELVINVTSSLSKDSYVRFNNFDTSDAYFGYDSSANNPAFYLVDKYNDVTYKYEDADLVLGNAIISSGLWCTNLDVSGGVAKLNNLYLNVNSDTSSVIFNNISGSGSGSDGSCNVALGYGTLSSNLTGDHSVAIGCGALAYNSIGTFNTAIGSASLINNISGDYNTAIGFGSLANNSIGNRNTSLGSASLYNNSSGISNTALGAASLYNNSIGHNNTAIGVESLLSNINGHNNTAIGDHALHNNKYGSNNIGIGQEVKLLSDSASNEIVIGYNAQGHGDDIAVIGNNSCISWQPPQDDFVDLGSSSFGFKNIYYSGTIFGVDIECTDLTVNGTLNNSRLTNIDSSLNTIFGFRDFLLYQAVNTTQFNDISCTNLEVSGNVIGNLSGNVTGNVSGTAATVTGAAQTAITSVGTLTALQVDNLNINGNTISSTAGTDLNITPLMGQQIVLDGAIAIDAGVVTGATSITSIAFVGDVTGDVTGNLSGNVTGNVISSGSSVLRDVSCTNLDVSGVAKLDNLYLNVNSDASSILFNNKSGGDGSYNIALGMDSLINNTTGYGLVSIGYGALQNNSSGYTNTAIGLHSLNANTDGFDNTALGMSSLRLNKTGNSNFAFGNSAMEYNVSGDYNVVIGSDGFKNMTDGSNNIGIGADVSTSSTNPYNQIVIGKGATGHEDNIVVLGNSECTSWHPSSTNKVDLGSSSHQFKDIHSAGTLSLVNGGFGAVLQGFDNGNNGGCHDFRIDMGGVNVMRITRFPSNGYTQVSMAGNSDVHTGTVSSDDRIKHNETDISNAISVIRQLSPQVYDKSPSLTQFSPTVQEAGFIAQEVEQITELAPYVYVGTDTELWTLNYNSLFTYSVAAIKELDVLVTSQSAIISSLEARITALGG